MNQATNYRAIRQNLNLNQQTFWPRLGVTQSGGSRYENERKCPTPIAKLVQLVYVLGIDIEKINESNAPLIRAILSGNADTEQLQKKTAALQQIVAAMGELSANATAISTAANDLMSA